MHPVDEGAHQLDAAPFLGIRVGVRMTDIGGVEAAAGVDDEDRADVVVELGDEVLTPDSSRFWPADGWVPGRAQPSFDKQFVRNWLLHESGWDRNSPPPPLPDDVVEQTRAKYVEAYERLTGEPFRPARIG